MTLDTLIDELQATGTGLMICPDPARRWTTIRLSRGDRHVQRVVTDRERKASYVSIMPRIIEDLFRQFPLDPAPPRA